MISTSISAPVPTASLPFGVQHQADSTPLEDRLDAAVAALGVFAFDAPQAYSQHPQHQHLARSVFSAETTSSCPSSSTDELLGGRFSAFHPHTRQEQGEGGRGFDNIEFFTHHELGFQPVQPSKPLGGLSSSGSPSSSESLLVAGGFAFNGTSALPGADHDFMLWPKPLTLITKSDPDKEAIPSVLKTTAGSPTSSCSSPSSTDSSPSSPSYDDIVLPVVACGNCKRSHIKCDHGRPCQNCLKHPSKIMNCHDAVPKPRGRPKGGSKAAAEAIVGGGLQHQFGLQFYAGSPYQFANGQLDQHQPQPRHQHVYRQRALSFQHPSSSHEVLPYVLQSQHPQQPSSLQHPHQDQPYPFTSPSPHHHHQPQQQQVQQYHQRAGPHPQARFPASNAQTSISSSAVGFHRPAPDHQPSPYPWGSNMPGVPELKSMPLPQRTPLSPPTLYEMQETSAHPIRVANAHPATRNFGSGQQTTQTGLMSASLPTQWQSPPTGRSTSLSDYQRNQLEQHRQKFQEHEQQNQFQRRGSQPQSSPHPILQHSFFS